MWTIDKKRNWESMGRYAWVKDMHGVPQSPVHHAEGDVAVHTSMVLAALETLAEYQALEPQAREVLWAATLMHDIEKRRTTTIDEQGNITAPGHAKRGALTCRQILYRDIPTPFDIREQVVGLVRYHGLPLWIFSKADVRQTLIKASLEVNTEWLYILAKADAMGRICADQDDLLYRLAMFRELCLEHQCWGQPRHFETALARFRYFLKPDQDPAYVPFDDTTTDVIIMSGIAGSGKDHYLSRNHKDLPVVSLDDMRRRLKVDRNDSKGNGRIIQAAVEQAKQYLRNGQHFAWNATNITLQMREQLIGTFAVYKPRIKLVYLEVPYTKLLAQNSKREHAIPTSAIERMIDRLEVPKLWETNEVVYIA